MNEIENNLIDYEQKLDNLMRFIATNQIDIVGAERAAQAAGEKMQASIDAAKRVPATIKDKANTLRNRYWCANQCYLIELQRQQRAMRRRVK